MSPEADLGRYVNQTEVSRLALPWVALVGFQNIDSEQGIGISAVLLIGIPGGELLVGGHKGRGNVVGKQVALGLGVEELDGILVANDAATTSSWQGLCRDDLPEVVGVVVGVTSDLLTLAADASILVAKGIKLLMGMKEDLGVFVLESDGVVVADFLTVKQELVSGQCLLEGWAHEAVASS